MQRPTNKQSGNAGLQSLVIVLVFVAALAAILYNKQGLQDYYNLHNYQPPARMSEIATQDTFTDYGRKVFYVNYPSLSDKAVFAQPCPSSTREQTIILGCYHGPQAGIFLLNVTDPRLNGVQQVTAAHEMLHAAYDRLGERHCDVRQTQTCQF